MTEDDRETLLTALDEFMTSFHRAGERIAEIERDRINKRDQAIRALRDRGLRPIDIQKRTGLSKETVRQILDPAAREKAKDALATRRAAQREE